MAVFASAALASVVLVHGAFVDGSGWEPVYKALKKEGYSVAVVQHPTNTLEDDVTITKRVIAAQPGPVVLVGHSYGGVIITEAGNDPKVKSLVYVAAFAPDKGESADALFKSLVPNSPGLPLQEPVGGLVQLDHGKFPGAFAGDLPKEKAEFMAASQLPYGIAAFQGAVTSPAWKSKPGWYLLAKDDKTIPPTMQREMAKRANTQITEIAASHAVYISHPEAVVALIKKAAAAAAKD